MGAAAASCSRMGCVYMVGEREIEFVVDLGTDVTLLCKNQLSRQQFNFYPYLASFQLQIYQILGTPGCLLVSFIFVIDDENVNDLINYLFK